MLMHKAAFAILNNEGALNGNSLKLWLAHPFDMRHNASS